MTIAIHKTKIRQIASRQVVTVTPDTATAEAINLMSRSRISCLVVAEGKKPVGIFTERDAVRLAGMARPFADVPIRELMTSPVVTISGGLSIYEAYNLMLTNRIRHHVVVDHGGRILGVMSQSDLIKILGLEYFVEMRKVEQVMSPRVITIDAGRSAHETLVMMSEPGVSCVVVTLNDRLAGIVTERDAVELLSEGENLKNVQISMVMSTPVLSVPVGTTVHKAAMIMKQEKIRRVVVVNSAGGIEGILTQSDIVKGLQGQYIDSLKEIIREKEDIFRQTARELLDKTVYLDNILTSAIDMVIIATDGDLRIKYYNPVAEKVFGYAAPQAVGRTTPELAELESIAPVKLQKARDIVKKEGKYHFRAKIAREGSYRYYDGVMSGIRDHQNRLIGYVLMLHDVTERKCHEDTIRHLAYHDALTGLPNRLLLSDRVTQVLSLASRNAGRGALMILDLDRFKDINDTLGHSTGDLLLKEVARRLLRLLRKSDTVSRMGGDEFVLLLPTTVSSESAAATASRIVKAFHKPFNCEGSVLHVTASIGIATYPDDGCDAETLLKKADIALYQAKEGGRNNYCRFLPT